MGGGLFSHSKTFRFSVNVGEQVKNGPNVKDSKEQSLPRCIPVSDALVYVTYAAQPVKHSCSGFGTNVKKLVCKVQSDERR